MLKHITDKLNKNKGSVSVEAALATAIIFPIFLFTITGGYVYTTVQSENVNFNFESGRYVSTTGCSLSDLSDVIPYSSKYDGYSFLVNGTVIQSGDKGSVEVSCPSSSSKGSEFEVKTELPVKFNFGLFKDKVTRSGVYVQEAD